MSQAARRVSAASARAHTRRQKQSSFKLSSGVFAKALTVLLVGVFAWSYQAFLPPPPKICGSPNGPPVTASRIKLTDGRHVAYKEHGVPKENAKHKIIFIHAFDSCRYDVLPISMEVAEELGIYLLSFDRPGYGESDPDTKWSEKSIAFDVEELADKMGIGSTFYVIGYSMGGQLVWSCLKYIPHRLAGAVLIAPAVNYWWPSFPANLSKEAYSQQFVRDQWAVRVAHYLPWLTYWWNTQKWFPAFSAISYKLDIFAGADQEILPKFAERNRYMAQIRQQGPSESLHRDMNICYGTWAFDPMDLRNPFPNNEGSVHLWQGDDDGLVPVILQRCIAAKLPWIRYHELPSAGHLFHLADGMADTIVKALVLGEQQV